MGWNSSTLLVAALAALTTVANAQEPIAPADRTLQAIPIQEGAVQLDGRITEEVWQTAPLASGFTQRDPDDGAPATEETEVRVAYSSSAIYVAVRAWDSEPDLIRALLGRRDVNSGSDRIGILFDSYDDKRTSFTFEATPRGSIRDVLQVNDNSGGDESWDPVWDVSTSIDELGWSAEFRIPLSQLRFDVGQTAWGFQVSRYIERKSEESWWAAYSKNTSGFASRFGRLEGLDNLPSPVRLEVRPYTLLSGQFQPVGTGAVYAQDREAGLNVGLDVKLGITSNMTLDVTVNPDFGQVEADPSVVNLTAFETFLPERRPFFVEGSALLPGRPVFYSRRIGRVPQLSATAPSGGTVEAPDAATILGAAKLTGKAGGLAVGLMSALTGRETATLRGPDGDIIDDTPVEPRTHYFAGRITKDLRDGSHTIGMMGTAVNRWLGEDFSTLRSAAYAFGIDGSHRWKANEYGLWWQLGMTHIRGSAEAIAAAQRSSMRYFQRPDASHVHLDPDRTSLSGYAAGMRVEKLAGSWRWWTGVFRDSPGQDVNDIGFQGRVDSDRFFIGGHYFHNRPYRGLREFRIGPDFSINRTTGGEIEEMWLRPVLFNMTFLNNWRLGLNPFAFSWNQWSPTALRGGPGLRTDTWHNSFVNLQTDSRKRVSASLDANLGGVMDQTARFGGVSPTLTFRPNPVVSGTLGISYNARRDPQEWVGRRIVADSTHYVIGSIDQETLSLTTRVDWTVSPRLSLQFYAQPFVSAGQYSDFKEVVAPNADEFDERFRPYGDRLSCPDTQCSVDLDGDGSSEFGFGQPDFNSKELRSTMIARWEYRPGSVLYVGWQHGRSERAPDGEFRAFDDLTQLRSVASRNTLLVKINYWMSR